MKKQKPQPAQKKQVSQPQANTLNLMITGQANVLGAHQQKPAEQPQNAQQKKSSVQTKTSPTKNKILKKPAAQSKPANQAEKQIQLEINNTKAASQIKKTEQHAKPGESSKKQAENPPAKGKPVPEQEEKKAEPVVQQGKAEPAHFQEGTIVEGKVVIKYSHYKEQFTITNGEIASKEIDEKYYFSGVFQGNYKIRVKNEKTAQEMQLNAQNNFTRLEDGQVYLCTVEEDEEAEKKVQKKNFEINKNKSGNEPGNQRIDNLTNQLKNMSEEELREKGDKYKELIEARDLEDILYK